MDIQELLYQRFIAPMECHRRCTEKIGVELEYPLVSLGSWGNRQLTKFLFSALLVKGFSPLYDHNHNLIGVEKKDIAKISLDTSYNNLEIAFCPVHSIQTVDTYWQEILTAVRSILGSYGKLADQGMHPQLGTLSADFLPDDELIAERNFIAAYSQNNFHGRSDFFAFISSVQTHLEFAPSRLPYALTVLSKLDFAEILLFANSPLLTAEGWFRCSRYYFYTRCALREAGLTGSLDQDFLSMDALLEDYAKRSLYFRWRKGQCDFFAPVSLKEYFSSPQYDAQAEDMNCFYSYRNTEIKRYGTVERRVICEQPFAQTFVPSAFIRGISARLEAADEFVEQFLYDYKLSGTNHERCELAARGLLPANPHAVYDFLGGLWQLALEGIREQGCGDEIYLQSFDEQWNRLIRWNENDQGNTEKI